MGKTTLALNIAINAARSGQRCGIFSLEMTRQQLAMRILSAGVRRRLPPAASQRLHLCRGAEDHRRHRPALRTAGLHRRHPFPDLHRNEEQGPAPLLGERAGRAGGGLSAADTGTAGNNQPGAGDQRDIQVPEGAGQGPERVPHHLLPAEPDGWRTGRATGPSSRTCGTAGAWSRTPTWWCSSTGRTSTPLPRNGSCSAPGKTTPRSVADIIVAKHRNGPTGAVQLQFVDSLVRFDSIG